MPKYQKYTQLEHILARPDTYIGSIQKEKTDEWVYDHKKNHMIKKKIEYSPGLYKIFDEIIVNAIDQSTVDPSIDTIKINIQDNVISVFNNGEGIPIESHETEKVMIPELIFGHLLTSENYDDSVKRTTGGRNGYGAKLANIFSKWFEVEIVDPKNGKKYIQKWESSMKVCNKPNITKTTAKKGYVKITFEPDLDVFNLKKLPEQLFEKRAYDTCACTNSRVKVYYNDVQLQVKTFEQYCDLYLGDKKDNPRIYHKNDRWEMCISQSDGFQQVSFVNGISTTQGGQHVDQVLRNITSKLIELHKKTEIKPQYIKEHVFLFVKATLENPTFSSQTKTECTSKWSTFGSKLDFDDAIIKKISKIGIMQDAIALAKHKELRDLAKLTDKKSTNIKVAKLDDANKAGGLESDKCTLILTEGDSAKTFAISGLSVIGRNYYGVFPLKGKLLNTREATPKQLQGNEEICNLIKIIGLQYGKKYKDLRELRYGKIMVLTDADVDGYHIKGLLINFIHSYWPELITKDFIVSLRTPIVKATNKKEVKSFYHLNEFNAWKESIGKTKWDIKYYKGLGTSTATEAKEYFKKETFDKNTIKYFNEKHTNDSILLAFKKEKADERKQWIQKSLTTKEILDEKTDVSYSDFINKELVWFSIADNIRSIPNIMDGMKPSQRKVIFACRKRKNTEIKVSQLSGYVSTETAYHHGEQSLMSTIITLAQNFVGTGNYNLLEPIGQFGTRLMGGKDAASPRYIFTKLSENGLDVFNKYDDPILDYQKEDNQDIEPIYYIPNIPLILTNGATGIGTGYSTDIPCYNPDCIKKNIKLWIKGKKMEKMTPWYHGFKGIIIQKDEHTYETRGIYSMKDKHLHITELPIGRWTQDYKEFLDDKFSNYENHSTDTDVHFIIKNYNGSDPLKELKLTSTIKTSNMYLFDENNTLQKYKSELDIIDNFCKVKMVWYQKRKDFLLEKWNNDLSHYSEQHKFIEAVMNEEIVVFRRKKEELKKELETKEFSNPESLLQISLNSFTYEKLEQLKKQIVDQKAEIDKLEATTTERLFLDDIE